MEKNRSTFSGKLGFVLAAAGSAVGLGNIWRFPYLAAKYGGGIFLLVYILLVLTFGFSLVVAEIAIGRKTGLSAVGAFNKLCKKFTFLGYFVTVIPVIILSYYSVIGGWVIKYVSVYLLGETQAAATGGYFGSFISGSAQPLIFFAIFFALTALVVLLGVQKGIERVSKIMMPVLIALSAFIAIYGCTIDGAWEGVIYYLKPDISNFSVMTVISAMGQLFYSLSIAMGIMITYGSYMKKDINIESAVHQIEIFDTGIAFLAGLMVIPAVFALSGPENLGKGPGLMFETLPMIFAQMKGGRIIGGVFFLLVFFAAITSSISLMEAVVSVFEDKFGWSRKTSCFAVLVIVAAFGIPSALGYGVLGNFTLLGMDFLSFLDFLTNSVMMPIAAILTCIFICYVIKPKTIYEEVESSGKFRSKKLFTVMLYSAPALLLVILVYSILEAFKIIQV